MYESGTLVWVKMRGYPLWPGRIQPDRVNNLYKQVERGVKYHVEFLNYRGEHAWVPSSALSALDLTNVGEDRPGKYRTKAKKYYEYHNGAVQLATRILQQQEKEGMRQNNSEQIQEKESLQALEEEEADQSQHQDQKEERRGIKRNSEKQTCMKEMEQEKESGGKRRKDNLGYETQICLKEDEIKQCFDDPKERKDESNAMEVEVEVCLESKSRSGARMKTGVTGQKDVGVEMRASERKGAGATLKRDLSTVRKKKGRAVGKRLNSAGKGEEELEQTRYKETDAAEVKNKSTGDYTNKEYLETNSSIQERKVTDEETNTILDVQFSRSIRLTRSKSQVPQFEFEKILATTLIRKKKTHKEKEQCVSKANAEIEKNRNGIDMEVNIEFEKLSTSDLIYVTEEESSKEKNIAVEDEEERFSKIESRNLSQSENQKARKSGKAKKRVKRNLESLIQKNEAREAGKIRMNKSIEGVNELLSNNDEKEIGEINKESGNQCILGNEENKEITKDLQVLQMPQDVVGNRDRELENLKNNGVSRLRKLKVKYTKRRRISVQQVNSAYKSVWLRKYKTQKNVQKEIEFRKSLKVKNSNIKKKQGPIVTHKNQEMGAEEENSDLGKQGRLEMIETGKEPISKEESYSKGTDLGEPMNDLNPLLDISLTGNIPVLEALPHPSFLPSLDDIGSIFDAKGSEDLINEPIIASQDSMSDHLLSLSDISREDFQTENVKENLPKIKRFRLNEALKTTEEISNEVSDNTEELSNEASSNKEEVIAEISDNTKEVFNVDASSSISGYEMTSFGSGAESKLGYKPKGENVPKIDAKKLPLNILSYSSSDSSIVQNVKRKRLLRRKRSNKSKETMKKVESKSSSSKPDLKLNFSKSMFKKTLVKDVSKPKKDETKSNLRGKFYSSRSEKMCALSLAKQSRYKHPGNKSNSNLVKNNIIKSGEINKLANEDILGQKKTKMMSCFKIPKIRKGETQNHRSSEWGHVKEASTAEASNNPSGTTGLEDHATTGFNDQRWNWVNNFDQGLPENTERDSNLSHIRQSFHQSTFPQSVHDHLNFQDHRTQSQVPAPYFQTSQLDQSSNFLQYHHQRLQDHRTQFPEGLNNLDYLQIDLNTSVHSIEEPGSIERFSGGFKHDESYQDYNSAHEQFREKAYNEKEFARQLSENPVRIEKSNSRYEKHLTESNRKSRRSYENRKRSESPEERRSSRLSPEDRKRSSRSYIDKKRSRDRQISSRRPVDEKRSSTSLVDKERSSRSLRNKRSSRSPRNRRRSSQSSKKRRSSRSSEDIKRSGRSLRNRRRSSPSPVDYKRSSSSFLSKRRPNEPLVDLYQSLVCKKRSKSSYPAVPINKDEEGSCKLKKRSLSQNQLSSNLLVHIPEGKREFLKSWLNSSGNMVQSTEMNPNPDTEDDDGCCGGDADEFKRNLLVHGGKGSAAEVHEWKSYEESGTSKLMTRVPRERRWSRHVNDPNGGWSDFSPQVQDQRRRRSYTRQTRFDDPGGSTVPTSGLESDWSRGKDAWIADLPPYTLTPAVVDQLKEKPMDSHCHLDFIFQRLPRELKINTWDGFKTIPGMDSYDKFGGLITNFCDPRDWNLQEFIQPKLMSYLQCEEGIYYTIGCHPHWGNFMEDTGIKAIENIVKMDRVGKCVAIGECGLDLGPKNSVPMVIQREVFKQQLQLAIRLNIPLVLHIRNAEKEAMEVLNEVGVPVGYYIHRHCFMGNTNDSNAWMERFPNSVFGFTNIITFPSMHHLHEVVRNLPLQMIVLETDAPYFIPKGGRGESKDYKNADYPKPVLSSRNQDLSHPLQVLNVAAQVAALKGLSIDEVLTANTRNIRSIYKIKN